MEAAKREFKQIINKQYLQHCESQGKEPNQEDLLEYLMNRNFIRDLDIKRFLIVTAYPLALDNLGLKTNAIWELEDKYEVSESTIRCYLERFQTYFRLKNG